MGRPFEAKSKYPTETRQEKEDCKRPSGLQTSKV